MTEYHLRYGSTTKDPRLTRLVEADPRFIITFSDIEKLLSDAGEVCFFKEVVKK